VAIAGELRKIGRLAGLDEDKMQSCLTDEAKAKSLIAWFQANATADNIDSTPSFIVNGKKYGNMSYGEFADLIDAKLAE
jgi:protein-disulfide isomerase